MPPQTQAQFVGRKSCVECHAEINQAWEGSQHDQAMEVATEQTVLGDFNDAVFEHYGVTSRFYRKDGNFYVETEGAEGDMQTYRIRYTFGVEPLQQYLVALPEEEAVEGGYQEDEKRWLEPRLQALPLAWDTEKKTWFLLDLEGHYIPAGDVMHWTGRAMNWNHMCANCHSTDVKKDFDVASGQFHTNFHEIDVSCESCHGPGSTHIDLAKAPSLFWDRNLGYGLPRLKRKKENSEPRDLDPHDPSQLTQIETCAPCHSLRHVVYPGFQGGDRYLDHFEPELLDTDIYHPDGQVKPEFEGYVYGSFLQSRMYREGVRCSDCHNPHTTKLWAEGNNLCNRCHQPAKYDTPTHHHHPVGSTGASCVECHMPETTYMHVDPRRDHSIRVPRPDLTVKLGVPNACNRCHTKEEETAEWATEKVTEWYGPKTSNSPHYGEAIAAGRAGDPEAIEALAELLKIQLDKTKQVGPLVRASAAALLGHFPGREVDRAIERALLDREPLVRLAAVQALEGRSENRSAAIPLLSDPIRAVRVGAVQVLASIPANQLPRDAQEPFRKAVAEFKEGLDANSDLAGSHIALGILAQNQGYRQEAKEAYLQAIELDPISQVARHHLAVIYQQEGQRREALKVLREGIDILPQVNEDSFSASAYYDLGLMLAEDPEKLAEAAENLGKAVELAPDHPRYRYNYGLALLKLQELSEAEEQMKEAVRLDPQNSEVIYALALVYQAQGNWQRVREFAEYLLSQNPQDPNARQLYLQVMQHLNATSP
ncbi:TPR repeat-containing protein YrrB [Planctomycetales bacterium 10988]|nr:TPR repeat-containing protein YrrB [Planctomycetales bacterium 10988]